MNGMTEIEKIECKLFFNQLIKQWFLTPPPCPPIYLYSDFLGSPRTHNCGQLVTFPRLKMANLNPMELIEIVEKVTFYLSLKDLKRISCVNSLWNQSCQKWINKRRQSYTSMR